MAGTLEPKIIAHLQQKKASAPDGEKAFYDAFIKLAQKYDIQNINDIDEVLQEYGIQKGAMIKRKFKNALSDLSELKQTAEGPPPAYSEATSKSPPGYSAESSSAEGGPSVLPETPSKGKSTTGKPPELKAKEKRPYYSRLGKAAHELDKKHKSDPTSQNEAKLIQDAILEFIKALLALLDLLAGLFKAMASPGEKTYKELKQKIDDVGKKLEKAKEKQAELGDRDLDAEIEEARDNNRKLKEEREELAELLSSQEPDPDEPDYEELMRERKDARERIDEIDEGIDINKAKIKDLLALKESKAHLDSQIEVGGAIHERAEKLHTRLTEDPNVKKMQALREEIDSKQARIDDIDRDIEGTTLQSKDVLGTEKPAKTEIDLKRQQIDLQAQKEKDSQEIHRLSGQLEKEGLEPKIRVELEGKLSEAQARLERVTADMAVLAPMLSQLTEKERLRGERDVAQHELDALVPQDAEALARETAAIETTADATVDPILTTEETGELEGVLSTSVTPIRAPNPANEGVSGIATGLRDAADGLETVLMTADGSPVPSAPPLDPGAPVPGTSPTPAPVVSIGPGTTRPEDAATAALESTGPAVLTARETRAKQGELPKPHDHLNFRPGDKSQMLVKPGHRAAYQAEYGADFFGRLAQTMVERSDEYSSKFYGPTKHKIKDRHADEVKNIIVAVRFAEFGAKAELADLRAMDGAEAALSLQKEYEKLNGEHAQAKYMAEAIPKKLGDLTEQIAAKEADIKEKKAASEDVSADEADLKGLRDQKEGMEKQLKDVNAKVESLGPKVEAKQKEFMSHDQCDVAQQIKEAEQKVMVAEKIRQTYQSIYSLSLARSRWTEENFNQKMFELQQFMKSQRLNQSQIEALTQAMTHTQEAYNFHGRKWHQTRWGGSTPYQSIGDEYKISNKYKKSLKIEHFTENGEKIVRGTFSFDRNALSGDYKSRFNPIAQQRAYNKAREQVSGLLNVAIGEHGKGSPENPIRVRYAKDKNGKTINQPEIGLLVMMDLKKRAITDNREFTVMVPAELQAQLGTDRIQIGPDKELTPQEKAIMRHYAKQPVGLHKGNGVFEHTSYGGAGILRHAGKHSISDYKTYKESKGTEKNAQRDELIDRALQSYVDKQTNRVEASMERKFDSECQKLGHDPKAEQRARMN